MKRQNPNDKITEHIQKFGWHCLHVSPTDADGDVLRFSYSIGFTESYGQPEILIFGLAREKTHPLLSECATLLSAGATFVTDSPDDRVLANDYKVVFRPVPASAFGEYLGTATRYYGTRRFSALVMYLPDRAGLFPWQEGYDGMQVDEAMRITGSPEFGNA